MDIYVVCPNCHIKRNVNVAKECPICKWGLVHEQKWRPRKTEEIKEEKMPKMTNRTPEEVEKRRKRIKELRAQGLSMPEIAKKLGYKNHTTVLYHLHKPVENLTNNLKDIK
ncbi:MAG: helix-turn-helix domain-containing protein [Patescibacteria group bacterium]